MIPIETSELVYSLLTLVPGYLVYQAFVRMSQLNIPYDRYEATLWSLIGSGIAVSVLYIAYRAVTWVLGVQAMVFSDDLTLQTFALGYPLFLIVALLSGATGGKLVYLYNRNRGIKLTRLNTWDYVHRMTESDTHMEVQVVTNSGKEIWGRVMVFGTSLDKMNDLLLAYPQLVLRDEQGEVRRRTDVDGYVYIREDDIAHMYINKTDNTRDLEVPTV